MQRRNVSYQLITSAQNHCIDVALHLDHPLLTGISGVSLSLNKKRGRASCPLVGLYHWCTTSASILLSQHARR